ncbi:hypothetical protein GA0070624_4622 [Micromonospora rhizosphaerae]|uniref:PH domain-containing protein n=1 Tax=Micromonospora rhizosphaerae TaxID=568872 RepID=A0A1C6STZ0_9ACTN|nr:hypothetical protein [Micromonospora rhizosphaerae]SCL33001.1 hypothetical protein GA0070624_4622 [Micromonospora rhizosphaerae]
MDERDGMTFRTSIRLMFMVMLLIGFLAWVFVQAVYSLVAGRLPTDLMSTAASGILYAVAFSALSLALHRRNWPSVHVSDPALGLAGKGRAAELPWPAIQSATVHRPGPFAMLQVTLQPGAVVPSATTLRPRMCAGQPVYTVNVGLLRPATRVLRTELARHLPEVASGP